VPPSTHGDARRDAALRFMPAVFVLLWSTGFIVARYGMPNSPPLTFLSIRYALSVLCFLVWIKWSRAPWPVGRQQWLHLGVTGILMHAVYLGGVWAAVKAGIGSGTVALLVSLQPVLTAVWLSSALSGRSTHDAASVRQWIGLVLGLVGLLLVVWRKLHAGEVTALNLGLAVLALIGITVGTLYQKRFVAPCDVRTANTVQLLAALVVSAPFAMFEQESVAWNPTFFWAMAWSVVGLTLGGSSLLYLLIQRGAATRVTGLLYMVPPTTALMAWALFDEVLTMPMLVGMALTAAGVALVVKSPSSTLVVHPKGVES
jgi:drug/metabolite transporter (DMT)-like permease